MLKSSHSCSRVVGVTQHWNANHGTNKQANFTALAIDSWKIRSAGLGKTDSCVCWHVDWWIRVCSWLIRRFAATNWKTNHWFGACDYVIFGNNLNDKKQLANTQWDSNSCQQITNTATCK